MTDNCPACGGTLFMAAGTTLEWAAQCERCLVRYAFADVRDEPRRLGRGWVYGLIWLSVGLFWLLGGFWSGGLW